MLFVGEIIQHVSAGRAAATDRESLRVALVG